MAHVKHFKEGLIEAIKAAGQMMIDNAEDIAGKTEYMSKLEIAVEFDPELGSIPEMTIIRSHLPNTESINHILDTFDGKKKEPVCCRDCGKVNTDHPDLKFYAMPDDKYLCKDCFNKTSEPAIGVVE